MRSMKRTSVIEVKMVLLRNTQINLKVDRSSRPTVTGLLGRVDFRFGGLPAALVPPKPPNHRRIEP